MCKFKVYETSMEGLVLLEPKVFEDERGSFCESYSLKEFKKIGIGTNFVQDNHSRSSKGVIRGLHFQEKHPQGKFVNVIVGDVFDVVVDIRKNSKTFGKWYGKILSSENKIGMYIPEGFAHGFLVLSDWVEFTYKCTEYYYPDDQKGIIWNDKDIAISWPLEQIETTILSDKDINLPTLSRYLEKL